VDRRIFGKTREGAAAELFTVANAAGMELAATNYGGIIVSLRVPDRDRHFDDVVLGYDALEGYLGESPYFGAIIGRHANRIRGGRFAIEGRTYKLRRNDGPNHLHGGLRGFDKVLWRAKPFRSPEGAGIAFAYTSPDGEEGYPGTLEARVTYTLANNGELVFEYRARTDKSTPVNLTQHSYFNLAGAGDILDHKLMLNADRFTPVDSTLIPTGDLRPVADTPFDFRCERPIGAHVDAQDEQIRQGQGYDHNFVLNKGDDGLTLAATVYDPASGRMMEIHTTEPGLQFYSGNLLDGTIVGKEGRVYRRRSGFCLETQHFPDSPNQPGFPSTTLRPGQEYRSRSVYRFTAR
jgi:aldose 1-epimerase